MITLPTDPQPSEATAGLIDFGGLLTPILGGPVQRINRLGNRHKLAVSLPPMLNKEQGRHWISRLMRGKTEGVRMSFPLMGFDVGVPGAPKVNGAGQSGRTINLMGCTPYYVFREGQPLSIVSGNQHYLYFSDGVATVSPTGTVALPISPMLRIQPAHNDFVAVAHPMIEGYIEGNELSWSMSIGGLVGLQFEIKEAR